MRSKKEQTEAKEGSGAGDSSFPAAPFPLLAAAAFGAPAIIPATASPDVGTPLANTYACVATKIKTNILTAKMCVFTSVAMLNYTGFFRCSSIFQGDLNEERCMLFGK